MGKVYRFWMALLSVLGGLSLLYFILLCVLLGHVGSFHLIWLCLALLCGGLILAVRHYGKRGTVPPKWVVIPVEILVGVGCILFIVIEAILIHAGHQEAKESADYLIILGAKVNGTQPSLILRYRIQAGAEYLKRNPDTMVIASGGQGADEDISEAQCIYEQLVAAGIEPERILLEDTSVSTRENLEHSAAFLDKETVEVVIATTDFHLFRAVRLAKGCGYEHVSGLPAKSVWWLIPTNYTRECLAVIKDAICGRL